MATQESLRELVRQAVRQALANHPDAETPVAYRAPWTGVEYEAHPSRSQFNILEAATGSPADLAEFIETKLCSIEKNRSCDQCGMCKTLGF
ncbi:MAG: hypothetical protein SF339_04555 [Blastocatellia bacterium]|nr:hypothetical protein [Blastocatellia bacterium]